MTRAKIFANGRSQAVRLPAEFRFTCEEVFIRRDPSTGDVILSAKPNTWDEFFKVLDASSDEESKDFLKDRNDEPPQARDDFDVSLGH